MTLDDLAEVPALVLALPGLGWLVLAVMVAGLVRGFAGFGSAMIIMPVASSVLTPVGALTFLIMTELFGPLPNLRAGWRTCDRGDVARLSFGALVALPLGVYGLSRLPVDLFGWVVSGVVLVLLVALMSGWRYHGRLTPSLVTGTGALGGAMAGAVGLAGPPVIMLYMASTLPIAKIRATLLLFLFVIDLLMITVFAAWGLLLIEPMVAGVLLAVPYMLANRAGALLFRPETESRFRAVAYTIIAASAILGLPVFAAGH
ncbi:sulfite exporter TauE/SafE family protein [Arenibacterium halophilum]|uniref:sulfite exporter TauE/SafE family protein n=1 Tax=Arenibacterium halophilum TaxID=2583821 RepID=UPI001FE57766|nr:sulfite exporter TauE/SafE family protein [Arenibacterium halophilum]